MKKLILMLVLLAQAAWPGCFEDDLRPCAAVLAPELAAHKLPISRADVAPLGFSLRYGQMFKTLCEQHNAAFCKDAKALAAGWVFSGFLPAVLSPAKHHDESERACYFGDAHACEQHLIARKFTPCASSQNLALLDSCVSLLRADFAATSRYDASSMRRWDHARGWLMHLLAHDGSLALDYALQEAHSDARLPDKRLILREYCARENVRACRGLASLHERIPGAFVVLSASELVDICRITHDNSACYVAAAAMMEDEEREAKLAKCEAGEDYACMQLANLRPDFSTMPAEHPRQKIPALLRLCESGRAKYCDDIALASAPSALRQRALKAGCAQNDYICAKMIKSRSYWLKFSALEDIRRELAGLKQLLQGACERAENQPHSPSCQQLAELKSAEFYASQPKVQAISLEQLLSQDKSLQKRR